MALIPPIRATICLHMARNRLLIRINCLMKIGSCKILKPIEGNDQRKCCSVILVVTIFPICRIIAMYLRKVFSCTPFAMCFTVCLGVWEHAILDRAKDCKPILGQKSCV